MILGQRSIRSVTLSVCLAAAIALLLLVLAACGGANEPSVPGAVSVHTFEPDECILVTTTGHPAYSVPGPGSIPVGTSLPGEEAVMRAATFSDGSVWYQKADTVWFSAAGAEYETRGDCSF